MKSRVLIIGASVIVLSVFLLADWNPGKYVPKENEELYGTWVNKGNYGGEFSPQKEITTAAGVKKFDKISDSVPLEEYTKLIDSKWTDVEGNIWYKTYGTVTAGFYKGYNWQGIDRLSKGATVWESCFVSVGQFDSAYYPTRIDRFGPNYRIEYRQKD